MKHCVFCCSDKCQDSIALAIKAKEHLDMVWMLEHDCVLQKYHSDSSVLHETSNTSVWLENSDIRQLIKDCMEYATVLMKLKLS